MTLRLKTSVLWLALGVGAHGAAALAQAQAAPTAKPADPAVESAAPKAKSGKRKAKTEAPSSGDPIAAPPKPAKLKKPASEAGINKLSEADAKSGSASSAAGSKPAATAAPGVKPATAPGTKPATAPGAANSAAAASPTTGKPAAPVAAKPAPAPTGPQCSLEEREQPRGGRLDLTGSGFGQAPLVRIAGKPVRMLERREDRVSVQVPADSDGGPVSLQAQGRSETCGTLIIIGKNR